MLGASCAMLCPKFLTEFELKLKQLSRTFKFTAGGYFDVA